MKLLKKITINIILILVSLGLVGIHVHILINYGYIRDEYYRVIISEGLVNLIWFSLFLSIIILTFVFSFIIINKENSAVVLLSLYTFFSIVVMYNYYDFSRDYPINVAKKADYIENTWLQGIYLNQVDNYTSSIDGDITMVYIGGEDCLSCLEFEKELIKQCKLYSFCMPTYYTDLDRSDNYDQLSDMLDKYEVTKVPTLIITKKATVIDKVSEPTELSDFMKKYLLK